MSDVDLHFETRQWDVIPAPEPEPLSVIVEALQASTAPVCSSPEAPSPFFLLPDSVCVHTPLVADSLKSALANAVAWHLQGAGVDTLLTDTPVLAWTFDTPGNYTITHTVWVLGCAYSLHAA
ncbi:MAG: hypothetical protein R2795_04730 [Saprospiraceae bacterium]